MHTLCNYYVENGNVVSRSTNTIIDEPACMIDSSVGCVLKVGNKDFVSKYFSDFCNKMRVAGINDVSAYLYITFDKYVPDMDADKVATLLNYMCNTIGPENMNALLSMNENELNNKIKTLQDIGF